MNAFELSFFPDAPSIADQFSKQGLKIKKKKAIRFQKVRLAIISLIDQRFISHKEGAVMAKKLADEIYEYAMNQNQL